MTTQFVSACKGKEDEGGGCNNDESINDNYGSLTSDQYKQASIMLNRHQQIISSNDSDHQQAIDLFVNHLDNQQSKIDEQQRRSSLPADAIELTTLSGVVKRRKQQLRTQYHQQQQCPKQLSDNNQSDHKQHLISISPKARPLSISSISSAASSGSSSSAQSSTSSGIQSSLTRNGSINFGNEYRKNYLASVESLNNSSSSSNTINSPTSFRIANSDTQSPASSSSVIENALKNLNLTTSGQFKDAATRAAILAAGESQRRYFGGSRGTSGSGSQINRSLHASLRYDKNTAYRIHLMANARALMENNCNQINSSTNSETNGGDELQHRRSSPISRNNSSTSSDSGHFRSPRNSRVFFACKCGQTMTSSKSDPLVIDRATIVASDNDDTNGSSTVADASIQLFNNKAATLDGASCSRGSDNNSTPSQQLKQQQQHQCDCPYSIRPRRASAKLQPSPSSASNHSNTSSLFRDDGFEDDLTSTSSEHASMSTYNRHHRLSFQGHSHHQYHLNQRHLSYNNHGHQQQLQHLLRQHGEEDDEYQSCEEEFSNSHTTASTTSNLDDCALSTTSSSILHQDQHILDKLSLATVKQQYRKSLLLEHQHNQNHHQLHSSNQNSKIQALLQPPPLPKLSHLPTTPIPINPNSSSASITSASTSSLTPSVSNKQSKCDDRTVNIIGHMPTKSPGYWDSNLSISQRVVTEIIETERTYVDDLEQIVTGYICYLRNILKQQHQQKTSGHNSRMLSNETNNKNSDDDDKSMLVMFDDEITSATNEAVDYDYDVEDSLYTADMAVAKENVSVSVPHRTSTTTLKHVQAESKTKEAMVSASNIKKLFSNLEDIYKFNKDLLFRLEECYLNPSSVAECFVENASGFEVYTQYCTMYPQVVSTLTELMADPTTAQLLKERQNELNQGLPLGAYLLKPVQRILKYHILFQSLINHTTDDESVSEKDGHLISEAFSVMTNIACHINTMKRRHEHSIRVQEVQGLLSGWEGPDLTTLGELILEDTFKLYNRQKSSRHLFLFDNVLLITKKKRDGSLCYKGHIECSNLMLIEKIEGQPLVFNTVPFDNPKALCSFQAKNLDKKRDWCLHMKEIIIKSFEIQIPVHVRDILMSLTNSGNTLDSNSTTTKSSSSETSRAIRAPNYLDKKRTRQLDKKK